MGGGPGSRLHLHGVRVHEREVVGAVRQPGPHGRGKPAGELVVDLDGDDPVRGLQQRQGQRAQAGPDLQHDVVRAHIGGAHDPAHGVRVDDEVLPALLGRADAHRRGQFTDVGRTEEGVRGVGHRDGARVGIGGCVHRASLRPQYGQGLAPSEM